MERIENFLREDPLPVIRSLPYGDPEKDSVFPSFAGFGY
jgi:hypothetical protein